MNVSRIFQNNEKWVAEKLAVSPDYFKILSREQTPEFLYIGCSDSRVTAEELMGIQPGQAFIHRNIANMVISIDLNVMSVLHYALTYLKVKQIVVCGHYGCGGVKAAMNKHHYGIINHWLKNIKDVYRFHRQEVDSLPTEIERVNRLTELNVTEQVFNLSKTSIIQNAWKYDNRPHLHGWVYDLQDGLLKTVTEIEPGTHLDDLYEYDNL